MIKRRDPRRKVSRIQFEDQLDHLLSGDCLDNGKPWYKIVNGHNFPFEDEEDRKSVYFANRDLLFQMAPEDFTCKREYDNKPLAYYQYEKPELLEEMKKRK